MSKKKWVLLAVVIVAIICLGGVGVVFFLAGSFTPPVDISGINVSSTIAAEEVLPDLLINESLNRGTIGTGWMSGFADGIEYYANRTSAKYNGITLIVLKTETEIEATKVFERYFDDPFESHTYGWRSKHKTPWWFTFEGGGTSGFAWISSVWIFGVEAENAEARNQAAEEWTQQLREMSEGDIGETTQ